MNMQERWNRLVKSVSELRHNLLQSRFTMAVVGADSSEFPVEECWDLCFEDLQGVLIPQENYSLLVNRLRNSYQYFQDAQVHAAVWEITQALRVLERLQHLQGY